MSGSLYALLADTVGRQPGAPAAEFSDRTLTYPQLRDLSDAVAETIRDAHPPVARVGLFAPRGTLLGFAGHLAALRRDPPRASAFVRGGRRGCRW